MLAEKDEWEDIEEDLDIVMQDIAEATGLVEGDDANGNSGTGVMNYGGDIGQNEDKLEEEEGNGDGDDDDDDDDRGGDGDGDDVGLGAEGGRL